MNILLSVITGIVLWNINAQLFTVRLIITFGTYLSINYIR